MDSKNLVDLSYMEKIVSASSSGSKGNQPKWRIGNKWYKGDFMGYEGLSELVVCNFLRSSNVDFYAQYFPVEIKCDDNFYVGCMSLDFLEENEMLIPIERLHKLNKGSSLIDALDKIRTTEDKIRYTVDFVSEITKIEFFGEYLTGMLELDALFLNEDRHTNNIAVIRNQKTREYRPCPYYDFGLSLMSDKQDYKYVGENIGAEIKKIKAKPFSTEFKKQRDAARVLYGRQIKFSLCDGFLDDFFDEYQLYYDEETIERAKRILKYQVSRNRDMFEIK